MVRCCFPLTRIVRDHLRFPFCFTLDFSAVNWSALADTIPAMFALTFFGILHVPINVPALGISTGEDNLNIDRELIAHGVSNVVSGFCGSIQVRLFMFYTMSINVDVADTIGP